jgi:hypothetical protein
MAHHRTLTTASDTLSIPVAARDLPWRLVPDFTTACRKRPLVYAAMRPTASPKREPELAALRKTDEPYGAVTGRPESALFVKALG